MEGALAFDPVQNGSFRSATQRHGNSFYSSISTRIAPLLEHLGDMAPALAGALGTGELSFLERRSWEIHCNWKVFVDNYLSALHPDSCTGLNSVLRSEYHRDVRPRCLRKCRIDPAGGEQTTAGVRRGEGDLLLGVSKPDAQQLRGYLDTNLVVPLGVDRMLVIFDRRGREPGRRRAQRAEHCRERAHPGRRSRHLRAGAARPRVAREVRGRAPVGPSRADEHLFHRLLAQDAEASRDV